MRKYSNEFFAEQSAGSLKSANEIVPHVIKLFNPKSIVDVGCGVGTWASAFEQNGVLDITGIDGAYINKEKLKIDKKKFISADLSKKLILEKNFDLAVCLEVGEHIPESSSQILVDSLVNLSSVVVFSAAIPFQGGHHHINEQWQSFWARKFIAHDYVIFDCIRPFFWNNENVEWWYTQNMIVYVSREKIPNYSSIMQHQYKETQFLDLVHPRKYITVADPAQTSLTRIFRSLIKIISKRLFR